MRLLTLITAPAWLLLFSFGGSTAAQTPSCKERCEAERQRLQKRLEDCLREVDPRPPDRAAKMRLLCRERYSPPRCDGLPPCPKEKKAEVLPPGMTAGAMIFSASQRGEPLARASYTPGQELFLRLEVEVRAPPKASRIWLRLDLRMLAISRSGTTEVARWDSYAEEQRFIDPDERGLPLRFTLHGGARLPADTSPGAYRMEAQVLEQVSRFKQTVSGSFEVRRGKASR